MDNNNRGESMIDLIRKEHKLYVDNVSVNAASLECCLSLIGLYDSLKPQRILDLGSGISSYCFRLFKKLNDLDTNIWSVDSHPGWLDKSRKYCGDRGLDTSNFITWDYCKDHKGSFDLIFVDIDMSPQRKLYLEPVFNNFIHPGSVVYLDDMHKSVIGYSFDKLMEQREYQEIDIKASTIDSYGRFGRMVQI